MPSGALKNINLPLTSVFIELMKLQTGWLHFDYSKKRPFSKLSQGYRIQYSNVFYVLCSEMDKETIVRKTGAAEPLIKYYL